MEINFVDGAFSFFLFFNERTCADVRMIHVRYDIFILNSAHALIMGNGGSNTQEATN